MDKESMDYHMDEERIGAGEQRYSDWRKDNLIGLKADFCDEMPDDFEAFCKKRFESEGDI